MANGIMFVTYNTLSVKARGTKQSRLIQLVEWLGLDFDEIIAFDESHAMANSIETVTKNGKKAPSLRGLKSMELQNILPNARILYVSATGASKINNLALLWREGDTSPLDKASFLSSLAKVIT